MKQFVILFSLLMPLLAWAQDDPSVDPTGTYYRLDKDGQEETGDVNSTTQSAPLRVVFQANPANIEGMGQPRYEWKVWKGNNKQSPIIIRTEQDMEYTFTESGSYMVQLRFTLLDSDGEVIMEFPEGSDDPKTISFSISESKLEFPNAFSPNGDGYNDTLRPKDDWQSIVSFEAAVFNRWGNKLYSWNDIHGSWDGQYGGKTVKDGVYFLVVNAKGADGQDFKIKKTITVLTGYNNGENTGTTGDE